MAKLRVITGQSSGLLAVQENEIYPEHELTVKELEVLLDISRDLHSAKTFEEAGKAVFDHLPKYSDISDAGGKFSVYNEVEDIYITVYRVDRLPNPEPMNIGHKLSDVKLFSKIAIENKANLLIGNNHSEYALSIDNGLINIPAATFIFIPLYYSDRLVGLFSFARKGINSISKDYIKFLEGICKYVSIAIANLFEAKRRVRAEEELSKYTTCPYESQNNGMTGSEITDFEGMISISPKMQEIFSRIPVIAKSDLPVLIEGETGTGKDLLANAIQNLSKRKDKQYMTVNCAAIPKDLFESELFGYVRGAFTGADTDREGIIPPADGGTLFLDEIGELPLNMQPKLLRFLQSGEFRPVGPDKNQMADVRIITASNRNLEEFIKNGLFRLDLLFRINKNSIHLPPLRERKEDIPVLIEHFIKKFNEKYNKNIRGISNQALILLKKHDYEGNIRELESIIESAHYLCNNIVIEVFHLPESLISKYHEAESPEEKKHREEEEKKKIIEKLEKNNWNVTKTCKELGIPRRSFYDKLNEYEIKRPG